MAADIDLSELVGSLKSTVNVPGKDAFPGASNAEWVAYLQNGFWDAMLDGIMPATYSEDGEGIVSPDSGTTPLSRELQQVVVFYASINVVRNQIRAINTLFRAKAGPVEYETQQSAQALKALLDDITSRRQFLLLRLSDAVGTQSYYVDMLYQREAAINYGYTSWIGA
jgi:hypothetical protein